MKVSEMNGRQKAIWRLTKGSACEFIGGYMNTLCDYPKSSEEYREAYEFLADRENVKQTIIDDVKRDREAQKDLKFVGNDFLVARAEAQMKRLYDQPDVAEALKNKPT